MNSQNLQNRLDEIQSRIDNLKKQLIDSQNTYQRALGLLTDPELRSLLMEQYIIHSGHQQSAIAEMEELYRRLK